MLQGDRRHAGTPEDGVISREQIAQVLDGATFSAKTDLIDGTNILPFQARYIALGQSVAGTANADATFKVQYL